MQKLQGLDTAKDPSFLKRATQRISLSVALALSIALISAWQQ